MREFAELLVSFFLLRVPFRFVLDLLALLLLLLFLFAGRVDKAEVVAPEEEKQLMEQFDDVLFDHHLLLLLLRLRILHQREQIVERLRGGGS